MLSHFVIVIVHLFIIAAMGSHCATLYSPRRNISHNGSEIIIPSSTVCVGVVGLLLLLMVGESFSVQPR